MDATVWSDLLCPWCYAGLDRTGLLEGLGVTVTVAPFELHPEFPPGGVRVQDGRRWDAVRNACVAAARPFRLPPRLPNTRRLLEAAEVLRNQDPAAQRAFHDRALRAAFAEGADLGEAAAVDALLRSVGADPTAVWAQVRDGRGAPAVDVWREQAFDAGIAATPGWLLDGRYVVPGVQSRDTFERAVQRLRLRPSATAGEAPGQYR